VSSTFCFESKREHERARERRERRENRTCCQKGGFNGRQSKPTRPRPCENFVWNVATLSKIIKKKI
jgi:hypothetical protein